jgi:hypothetical protein
LSPRNGGTNTRATKKPIIVVAGESGNDRAILRDFLEAFCPEIRGRIVFLNEKVSLRDARDGTLKTRVEHFKKLVQARAAREKAAVAGVFLHEDLDEVDSSTYDTIRSRVQQALARELLNAHYVLAVWEIEAWLLLFPESIAHFNTGWGVPARRRRRDTGRFQDPKRIFKDEVSKNGVSYRETDGPGIAGLVVARGEHLTPDGSNRSFADFRADVDAQCGELTDSRR